MNKLQLHLRSSLDPIFLTKLADMTNLWIIRIVVVNYREAVVDFFFQQINDATHFLLNLEHCHRVTHHLPENTQMKSRSVLIGVH